MSSDTGQNVPADAAGPAVVAAVTRFLASHGKGLPSHDDCLHHVRASALGAGLEEQRLAVLVRAALLNTVACEDEANAPVVDECIRRIREAGDGGDSHLDEVVAPGVRVVTLSTEETGFAAWTRADGEARGGAEWIIPPPPAGRSPPPGPRTFPDRILFFHGGGYQYYSPSDKYRPLTSRIAARTGMPVLAVDYRKLPEHRHPSAVSDAVRSLAWIWGHGPASASGASGASPASRVFLCGDSAGGGLAFACVNAVLLGEVAPDVGISNPPRLPCAVAAISPYTDCTCSQVSYRTRVWREDAMAGDPVFSDGDAVAEAAACAKDAEEYYGPTDSHDPRVSPVFAAPDLLKRLPPTFVVVGDAEVMLCDSTEFVARAVEAGAADVRLRVYPRMWHDFPMYSQGCLQGPAGTLAAAEAALAELCTFLTDTAAIPCVPS